MPHFSGIGIKPRTHEQIKYSFFEQILADLLHNDPKIAQIKCTLFAHVYKALWGRLHELKKGLFSAPKLGGLQRTGPKLELKTGPFGNAP